MSISTDAVISSIQTTCDRHNEQNHKQFIVVFDENQCSYQLLTWHCCQFSSKSDRQLIMLVKENENENAWLGTLTTKLENESILWINNLNYRQHRLHLSEEADSRITHYEIQETIDSIVRMHLILGKKNSAVSLKCLKFGKYFLSLFFFFFSLRYLLIH